MKIYRCMNCGFIFKTPEIKWKHRDDLNPGRIYAIDPEALYKPQPVCPKCGSDAIQELEV